MPATAPTVAINGIPDGKQRDDVRLSLDITGGNYNTITYSWSSNYGGTDQFNDHTAQSPTWTRPDTDYDRNVSIQCTVNVTLLSDGTTASRTDTEPTTILHLPNADAPSINVLYPPEDFEGREYYLDTEVGATHEGTYDTLTYNWFVFHEQQDFADEVLDDRTLPNPTWTRNRVSSRTLFQINCNLRAHGTNGNALRDTQEFTQSFVQPWVDDIPDADAPSTDGIQTTNTDPTTVTNPVWNGSFVTGIEGTSVWVRILIGRHGGLYDELDVTISLRERGSTANIQSHAWTWMRPDDTPTGGHPVTSPVFEFTRPAVDADTEYVFHVAMNARGMDREAEINTNEATSFTSVVGTVRNFPQAQAPTLLLQHDQDEADGLHFVTGFPNLTEGSFVFAHAAISGGLYDEITYSWERVAFGAASGTGTTDGITEPDEQSPIIGYPHVAATTQYDVICTVTVRGNGTNAEAGSSATVTDRRFFFSNALPDTDAPSINIDPIPTGIAGTTVQLTATLGTSNAGLYDRAEYLWSITEQGDNIQLAPAILNDRTHVAPIMQRLNVLTTNQTYVVTCTLTAYGNDGNSNTGTSEATTSISQTAVVTPLPEAAIPPAIIIEPIPNGLPGSSAHVQLDFATGTYDTVSYSWSYSISGSAVSFGGNTAYPIFHRPTPQGQTAALQVTVSCLVTVVGTGMNARDGSTAQQTYTTTTTLLEPPPVPPAPPVLMVFGNRSGSPVNINEAAWRGSLNSVGRTISEVIVTSENGTPIEVWSDGS